MTTDEIRREAEQVRQICGLKVVRPGFIAVHGFTDREEGFTYFTGEDLYR